MYVCLFVCMYVCMYVYSYVNSSSKARSLTVFTQDLVLHARGRCEDGSPVHDLGVPIAWSPNGALIAMAQVRHHVHIE